MTSAYESSTGDMAATAGKSATSRIVVAVVVEWRGRIGLFRRSQSGQHDRGRWHCITGYVGHRHSPIQQALEELYEETGLKATDLIALRPGSQLHLDDHDGNTWIVHTFTAATERRRLTINWEHESYRWVTPRSITRFSNRVAWLDDVVHATAEPPIDRGRDATCPSARVAMSHEVLPTA